MSLEVVHDHLVVNIVRQGWIDGHDLLMDGFDTGVIVSHDAGRCEGVGHMSLGHHSPGSRLTPVDCPGPAQPILQSLQLGTLLEGSGPHQIPSRVRVQRNHHVWHVRHTHSVEIRVVHVRHEP